MNSSSVLSTTEDGALLSFSPPPATSPEQGSSTGETSPSPTNVVGGPGADADDGSLFALRRTQEDDASVSLSTPSPSRQEVSPAARTLTKGKDLLQSEPGCYQDEENKTPTTTTTTISSPNVYSPYTRGDGEHDMNSLHLPMPLNTTTTSTTTDGAPKNHTGTTSGWTGHTSSTVRSTTRSREGTPSSLASGGASGQLDRAARVPRSPAGAASVDGMNSVTMNSEVYDGSVWIPHHIAHTALPSPAHSVSFCEHPMKEQIATATATTITTNSTSAAAASSEKSADVKNDAPLLAERGTTQDRQGDDDTHPVCGGSSGAVPAVLTANNSNGVQDAIQHSPPRESPTPPSMPQVFPRFSSVSSPLSGTPEREGQHNHHRMREGSFFSSSQSSPNDMLGGEHSPFQWTTSLLSKPPSQLLPSCQRSALSPPPYKSATIILPEEVQAGQPSCHSAAAPPPCTRRAGCQKGLSTTTPSTRDGPCVTIMLETPEKVEVGEEGEQRRKGSPQKNGGNQRAAVLGLKRTGKGEGVPSPRQDRRRQENERDRSVSETSSDFTLPASSSSSDGSHDGTSSASPLLDPSYLFSLSPMKKDQQRIPGRGMSDRPPNSTVVGQTGLGAPHGAGATSPSVGISQPTPVYTPLPLSAVNKPTEGEHQKASKHHEGDAKRSSSSDGELGADFAVFAPVFSFDETSKEVIDNRQQTSPFPSSPGGATSRHSPSSGAGQTVSQRLKNFSQIEPTTSVNRKKSAVDLLMLASASSAGSGPRTHTQTGGGGHHSGTTVGGSSSVASPPSLSVAANSSVGTAITASFTRHATNVTSRQHHDPAASASSLTGGILQQGGGSITPSGVLSFASSPNFMTGGPSAGIPQRPSFTSFGGVSPYPESTTTTSRMSPNGVSPPSYASSTPSPGVEKTTQGSGATSPPLAGTTTVTPSINSSTVPMGHTGGSRNSTLNDGEDSVTGIEMLHHGVVPRSELVSSNTSPNQPYPTLLGNQAAVGGTSNDSSFTLTITNSLATGPVPSGAFPSPPAAGLHGPSRSGVIPLTSTPSAPSHVSERLTHIVAQLPPSKQTAALIFLEGLLSDAAKEGAISPSPTLSSVVGSAGTLTSSLHGKMPTAVAGAHLDLGGVPDAGAGASAVAALLPGAGAGAGHAAVGQAVVSSGVVAGNTVAGLTPTTALNVGVSSNARGAVEEVDADTGLDLVDGGSSGENRLRKERHSIGAGLPSLLSNMGNLDFFVPPVPTSSPVENLAGPFPPRFSSPAVESLVQDALSQSVLRNMDLADPELFHSPTTYPHYKDTLTMSRAAQGVESSTASTTTRSRLVSPTTGLPHGVQRCSNSSQNAVGSSTSRRGGDFMFPITSPPPPTAGGLELPTSTSTTCPINNKTLAPTSKMTSGSEGRKAVTTTTTTTTPSTTLAAGQGAKESLSQAGDSASNGTMSAGEPGSVISSNSALTGPNGHHSESPLHHHHPHQHSHHHVGGPPHAAAHRHSPARSTGASPPSPSSLGRTAELFLTGAGENPPYHLHPSSNAGINDTPATGTTTTGSTTESNSHVSGFPHRRSDVPSNQSATFFSSAFSSPFTSPSTPVGPSAVPSPSPPSVGAHRPRANGAYAVMGLGQSAPVGGKSHHAVQDVPSLLSSTSHVPHGGSKRNSNESSTTTNMTTVGGPFPPCVTFNKHSSAPVSVSASRTFYSGVGEGREGRHDEHGSPVLSSTSQKSPSIMGSRHWTGRSRRSVPSSSVSISTTPSPDHHLRRGAVTVPNTPSLGFVNPRSRKGASSCSPHSGVDSDGRSSPASSHFFSTNQSFHSSPGGGVGPRGSVVYRENRSSRLSSGQFSPALHSSTEDTDDAVDPSKSLREPASPRELPNLLAEPAEDNPEALEAELIELRFLVSHYEPFFHLSTEQLDGVINSFQRQVYTKNSLVVEEGGASLSSLILLMTGRLSFESGGKSHGAMTHRLFYGEMEMSYDLQRSSTTMRVVSDNAVIYFLPREEYNALVVDERKARHKDVSNFVNKIPLFQIVSFHVRQLLVKAFSVTRIEEGSLLTTKGKVVDTMFIIITGKVQMKGRRPPNDNSTVIGKSGIASANSDARSPNTTELTRDSSVAGGSTTRLLKAAPGSLGSSSTDLPLDYVIEKGPGDMIGEPEFIFKSAALFDAVALTSLQVAKVSGLQFETTVSHTSIHKMKYFISTEKMYDYYQMCPTTEMLHEMNHVTHRQRAMESNRKRERSRRTRRHRGTSASAPEHNAGVGGGSGEKMEDCGKTMTSASILSADNRSSNEDNVSEPSSPELNQARAAMLTDAAMGGFIGSLSSTSASSSNSSSSFSSSSTKSTNKMDGVYRRPRDRHLTITTPTACFNDESFPMDMQRHYPPGFHRSSVLTTASSHHHHHHHGGPSVMQLAGGPISNLGEIIFSGSKNLYRFHADSLDTNGTTLVGVIVDGTIIRWNAVMQKITGFAPTEVIGQSIYNLLSNEESRQRMRSALQLSMQYTGAWPQYVKEELSHQSVFSFRQHTGLYAVGIAFCVVPSLCAGTAQVLLLIGRAAQMRSASHYADDVTRWLQTSLAPQLRVCQDCLVVMDKKKWVVTQDEAVRLHTAIDISMYMVQQFIRFSKLNQESFNQALRPLRLPALMRYFTKEAWSIVKQTNHSFDSNYESIPQFEVFMEPQKVVEALKGILLDVLRSAQENTNINVALLITMVDPEIQPEADVDVYEVPQPSRRESLASSAASAQFTPTRGSDACKNTPLADAKTVAVELSHPLPPSDAGTNADAMIMSEATESNTTPVSNSSMNLPTHKKIGSSTDPSIPLFPAPLSSPSSVAANSSTGQGLRTDASLTRQLSTAVSANSPYAMGRSPNYPAGVPIPTQPTLEAMLGLNTPILYQSMNGNLESLCSVRRIRFEMRDSGTPMMKSHNANNNHGGSLNPSENSQNPGTPGYCSPKGSCSPTAETNPSFPGKKAHTYRRGQELEKITPLIADLGGILYGFYSKVMGSNVMRMELPLLLAPGKSGALGEDGEEGEDEVDEQGQAPVGGGTHTVIVADNNRVQTNTLCQILWARQHAVVPVSSYSELMRQMENGIGNILMIDPINLTITQQELDQLRGDNPFDTIIDKAFGMVVVVMVSDWGDWRVQKLLTLKNVIKLPKTGASAQIHIAIQVAEKEAAEIQEERERFDIIRRTFTSAVPNRHKVVRLLGKGSFGDVFEVEDTLTGGKMAMKEMRLSNTVDPDTVVQELLAMTALQHENIIRYFFCEKASDSLLQLYMEVATGGTLKDRVRATGGKGLPLKETIQYLHDTCNGLAYIHSQRYVHRDLKSANLLLDKSERVKIGDFGTAKKIKPHEQLYRLVGTPQYIAPEVFSANMAEMNGYSFKVDVWSVGCVAMELATGQPPFSHLEQAQGVGIMKYLTELTSEPDITPLERCHPLLHNFVKQCLQFDPTMRPTADQLLEHELFHHEFSDEEDNVRADDGGPSSTADPSSPTSLHRGITEKPSADGNENGTKIETEAMPTISASTTASTTPGGTSTCIADPSSPLIVEESTENGVVGGGGGLHSSNTPMPPKPPAEGLNPEQPASHSSFHPMDQTSPLGCGLGHGRVAASASSTPTGSPGALPSSPNSFHSPVGLASASTRPSSATGIGQSGTGAASYTETDEASSKKHSFVSVSSVPRDTPEASNVSGTRRPMEMGTAGSSNLSNTTGTAATSTTEGTHLMKWKEADFFSDSDSEED